VNDNQEPMNENNSPVGIAMLVIGMIVMGGIAAPMAIMPEWLSRVYEWCIFYPIMLVVASVLYAIAWVAHLIGL